MIIGWVGSWTEPAFLTLREGETVVALFPLLSRKYQVTSQSQIIDVSRIHDYQDATYFFDLAIRRSENVIAGIRFRAREQLGEGVRPSPNFAIN